MDNLPYGVRDEDMNQEFAKFGAVTAIKLMMERDTGRSKSFGFVEICNDTEAQAAIQGMNGQSLGGRAIVVNEARPMELRAPRTGGYGGGGRGGREGGGGGGYGEGGDRECGAGGGRGDGDFRSPYGSGLRNTHAGNHSGGDGGGYDNKGY